MSSKRFGERLFMSSCSILSVELEVDFQDVEVSPTEAALSPITSSDRGGGLRGARVGISSCRECESCREMELPSSHDRVPRSLGSTSAAAAIRRRTSSSAQAR